jgi:hypothetical protein
MKVVFLFNFLLICADHHAPEKTRRKTEVRKSREKTLSRKPRILGAIGAASEVISLIQIMIKLVSALNENSEPFDDCQNHPVKDKVIFKTLFVIHLLSHAVNFIAFLA